MIGAPEPHHYVETNPYKGCGQCGIGPGAFHHNTHEVNRYLREKERPMAEKNLKYTDVMKPEDINVATLWTIFAGAVLPADAGPVQREEMKKAFYAGFFESFKIFVDISTTLTEQQAVQVLDRLNKESKEFFEKMMKEHIK